MFREKSCVSREISCIDTWCLSMYVFIPHALHIVSCSQKWQNQCADRASRKLAYHATYQDILVYPVTYHSTPPCALTPNFRTSAYVSGGVKCIHQVHMHLASHPGGQCWKKHRAEHASDIPLYPSISKYILVYDVSYNLTPNFTLNQAQSALCQAQAGYESICWCFESHCFPEAPCPQ